MRNPLSFIYGCVMQIRNKLYDRGIISSYRSSLPVVSIGNVTVGGNAKTPLAYYVARELITKDFRPVILSRGYGGKEKGPLLVSKIHSPLDVGDEPLLLHKEGLIVVVARRRADGARLIEKENLGDVIILDDGFQHRSLKRDVDLVTVDVSTEKAVDDFLEGETLPGGLFREPRKQALRRANMIVLSERKPKTLCQKEVPKELLSVLPTKISIFRSYFEIEGVFSLKDRSSLPPCPVVAFCGIAKPQAFFETLSSAGYSILQQRSFPDHHNFSSTEISDLKRDFPGVPLVCTSKDAMRLVEKDGIYELRIHTKVHPSDAFGATLVRLIVNR